MLSVVASLAVTIGCLALGIWALRRWAPGGSGEAGLAIEILRRVSLGPKQGVALLRVGQRVLLVSMGDDGARLLTELEGSDRAEALQAPQPPARALLRPGRLGLLKYLPLIAALLVLPVSAQAQAGRAHRGRAAAPLATVQGPAAPRVTVTIGQGSEQLQLSGAVGIVVFMGAMTLLPAIFLLTTSFTRIVIVLQFLRTALGTQTAPPGQVIVALAVLLTGVVMHPVLERANTEALQPYLSGQITQADAYHKAAEPLRHFMIANTREKDLGAFVQMTGQENADSVEALPTLTITAAFVTSELRTAFQMGFVIFLPFVVVDLIVASVLMSMGMFMLPPAMVSLPFKLMLFVLADGWSLVVQRLVAGYQV
ncbi:MAG TPA: flagellar type III secretion system pore protein FliP [Gemmatimonadales bacterium]|nr:flagellar type III secretion system pore protein FliP [Gemmatimonadales bacterium]